MCGLGIILGHFCSTLKPYQKWIKIDLVCEVTGLTGLTFFVFRCEP